MIINTKKVIYLVIALVVLAELVWAVYSLTKPAPKKAVETVVSEEKKLRAKLKFTGPSTASQGAIFKVDVVLSSTQPTGGVDLITSYDPKILELQPSTQGALTMGKIYQEYPVNKVDETAGMITVTGLTSPSSKGFAGEGVLSTMTFKAKSKGLTKVSLDFTKGSTTDTNIAEYGSGVDMLDEVSNYTVSIN